MIHEAVVTQLSVAVFAVASTTIEFVLILLVPPSVVLLYYDVTKLIRRNHLSWLFTEESEHTEFDQTLKRMPAYSTTEVAQLRKRCRDCPPPPSDNDVLVETLYGNGKAAIACRCPHP